MKEALSLIWSMAQESKNISQDNHFKVSLKTEKDSRENWGPKMGLKYS